jgi:U4/U6 small nuclear ribonucleoprotein PRP3
MIYCVQSQYGEAKAKEMKAKQAALAMAKADFDINPNLIEVSERVPIKEEKPKDAIPDVEWWYGTKPILFSPF